LSFDAKKEYTIPIRL